MLLYNIFLKGGVGGHGRIYIIYIRAREKEELR